MLEQGYRDDKTRKRRKRSKDRNQKQVERQRQMWIGALVVFAGACILAGTAWGRSRAKEYPMQSRRIEPAAVRETAAVIHEYIDLPDIDVLYGIHSYGGEWSHFFADNSYGMAPMGSYLTAMRATLRDQPADLTGTIEYSVNLSGSGWLDWCQNAEEAGAAGGEMALEAIRMRLTGDLAEYYEVFYSVLQNNAWTDWVKNGEESGVSGAGLHVDGVRISVVLRQEGKDVYASGIDPEKPMVALTYDDGPSAGATPRILEKLKEYGGRATFFMVGKQAEKQPDLIRQMVAQGCEVANHTYSHISMEELTPEQLTEELERTNRIVADASGVTPVLMRPVGGARTDVGMNAVGAISMPAILWSIDTLDWKTRDAAATVQAVCDNVKDGDIILMHDLYNTTADASMTIIEELTAQGFQLVTVSELSSYRGGILPGRTYGKFLPEP